MKSTVVGAMTVSEVTVRAADSEGGGGLGSKPVCLGSKPVCVCVYV